MEVTPRKHTSSSKRILLRARASDALSHLNRSSVGDASFLDLEWRYHARLVAEMILTYPELLGEKRLRQRLEPDMGPHEAPNDKHRSGPDLPCAARESNPPESNALAGELPGSM